MKIDHISFELETEKRVNVIDITEQVVDVISNVHGNGIVFVYSPHTTCSVQIQELSDGQTDEGTELIMQDLVEVFDRIIPKIERMGQYLHPNQAHLDIAARERGEENEWCFNTDAHLRSVILGRHVMVPLQEGRLLLGEFGRIFFADWDQTRNRKREVIVSILSE